MKFFTTEKNLSVISSVFAISVVSIVNWKVYQIGSIPFTGYSILTLTAAAIFLPKKILLPALVGIVGLFWLNLNHLSIGVIHSEIDVRTLFSLICLIWPLFTLVTAEQIDERVKTKAVKQAFVAIAIVQCLFYFIFPSWGVNNLVNTALCLAILVGIRKYSVLHRYVKYALVALSILSYALNLVYANGLTFYVVSLHLLFFYLLLPRFWASMLALCYLVLAVLMLSLNDSMVIRGVLSALFVAYLFDTLMRSDGARVSENATSNTLNYKVIGISTLISLVSILVLEIPYLLSGDFWWESDTTPIFIFSNVFVLLIFSIFVYQLALFIKERQDESNQLIQSLQQSRHQLNQIADELKNKVRETELALLTFPLS
ncbi:hypothetical protein [Marinobacterium sp. xm-d-564]|uniref:hypothetical protein n=1 Tax=Marinobacterium sp. xm-d-564 TaxID=2497742 RepID=UPI001569B8F4|nr:hypothetical protein [Marinobacterium sp. xm-d-564]